MPNPDAVGFSPDLGGIGNRFERFHSSIESGTIAIEPGCRAESMKFVDSVVFLNEVGKKLRADGYIKGTYEFLPTATPIQAANGQLILFVTVTPAFELIRVTNITSITLQ